MLQAATTLIDGNLLNDVLNLQVEKKKILVNLIISSMETENPAAAANEPSKAQLQSWIDEMHEDIRLNRALSTDEVFSYVEKEMEWA